MSYVDDAWRVLATLSRDAAGQASRHVPMIACTTQARNLLEFCGWVLPVDPLWTTVMVTESGIAAAKDQALALLQLRQLDKQLSGTPPAGAQGEGRSLAPKPSAQEQLAEHDGHVLRVILELCGTATISTRFDVVRLAGPFGDQALEVSLERLVQRGLIKRDRMHIELTEMALARRSAPTREQPPFRTEAIVEQEQAEASESGASEPLPTAPETALSDTRASRPSRPHFERIQEALHQAEQALYAGLHIGPYLLTQHLGDGAFGDVWLATDTRSDGVAAVKVFKKATFERADQLAAAERFWDGATAMHLLRGAPNIAEILDGPDVSGPHIYFAMRYYPGRDLHLWRSAHDTSTEQRIHFVWNVISALRAAHSNPGKAIVHRDVRPKNVLIDDRGPEPIAVLTDFDIAYYEDHFRQRTRTRAMPGEQRFIPPDIGQSGEAQLEERLRRPSNDLYALAVLMLDLFTAEKIDVGSDRSTIAASMKGPRAAAPGVWVRWSLAGFLHKALQSPEAKRFRTIHEFEQALTDALRRPWAFAAAMALALCCSVGLFAVADWAWCAQSQHLAVRSVVGIGAMLAAVATPFGGWALVAARVPSRVRQALAAARRYPTACVVALAAAALATIVLAFLTDLPHRQGTARIVASTGCFGLDHANQVVLHFPEGQNQEFPIARVVDIACVARSEQTRVEGLSKITPVPNIRSGHDVALVASLLDQIDGGRVTIATLSGTLTRPLRGVLPEATTSVPSITKLMKLPPSGRSSSVRATLKLSGDDRQVDVLINDNSLGARLVELGIAAADPTDPIYKLLEEKARRDEAGRWAPEGQVPPVDPCPPQCCPRGGTCDQFSQCTERVACEICTAGTARWRLRLSRLDFPDAHKWNDVQVCLNSRSGSCKEACVAESRIGTPLAQFDCVFDDDDLGWSVVKLVGKEGPSSAEVRIAEAERSFSPLNPKSACAGLVYKGFRERNGRVNTVAFDVSVDTPNTAGPASGFQVYVTPVQGERTSARGRRGHYYRLRGVPSSLEQIRSVSMAAFQGEDRLAMNGPIAWQGCGIDTRREQWQARGDGTLRTCDDATFADGCECRFVLTSKACPRRTTIDVLLKSGARKSFEFDTCALVGEQGGGNPASLLIDYGERGWESRRVQGVARQTCSADCGPPVAE